jgi:hypothetical protein
VDLDCGCAAGGGDAVQEVTMTLQQKFWYRWSQLKFFKTEYRHREQWNKAYRKRMLLAFSRKVEIPT